MPGHRRRSIVRLALATILAATFLGGSAAMPVPTAAALSRWTGGIDLYRSGVFTTQKTWLWCTAADVQIIRNIVDHTTDHTRANQQRYFDYMRAHDRYAIPVSDGTDPGGWAAGLRHYVDSRYRVVASTSFNSALRSAVTNLRKTNRPVAITVQHGNHGWVLTGFTATADPAVTTPLHGDQRPGRRSAVGAPEPFLRLRHAARHEAHAEPIQVVLHAVALRPDPDGVGRRLGLDPGRSDSTSGRSGGVGRRRPRRPRRSRRPSRHPAPTPTPTPTPTATPAPSDTPDPTAAAIAAVAGPISSPPPDVAAVSAATQTDAGWDPWAVAALAAALLLVLGAAILGGPGRNTRLRASPRARTGGTLPRQRS